MSEGAKRGSVLRTAGRDARDEMRLGDAAEHEERSRLKFTLRHYPFFFDCGRVLFCGRPRGSRGRLGRSVIRVASAAEPSLSAVTGNPSPGFGFGFEAGDLLGMAARPDGHYAPFVPCLYRLGIDPDALMRFGHARHYAPWPSRKPPESGACFTSTARPL